MVAPHTRRILVHADLVGAVVMPWALAQMVSAQLEGRGKLGPTVEHRHSGRVTFLTLPAASRGDELLSALLSLNIAIASTYTVLPSPTDELSGFRVWRSEPNSYLPTQRAVLDAALGARSR